MTQTVMEAPKTPEAKIIRANDMMPPPTPVKTSRSGMTIRPPPPPSPSPRSRPILRGSIGADLRRARMASTKMAEEATANTTEARAEAGLSTPIVTAAELQSPFTPSSPELLERFPVGQEVFLLDAGGNSIIGVETINPAMFDTSQLFNPITVGGAHYVPRFEAPNIFLIAGRYMRTTSDGKPLAAGAEKIVYKISPRDGNGRDRMGTRRDLLLEIRFRPGDRVYYLEKEDGSETVIKWEAVVHGAEVIQGHRIYEVYVIQQKRNKILVTDDLLEAYTGNGLHLTA
ncbi:hypothetical protein PV11_02733 [Exophiala sideris]|uniref:Uncharacterized protein n=1 Tax=Exophiala sideris TaxID=1016849 RepID=A0A0D1ZK46_9EURO|nr:hypothetical protein PV11_02733 [Exophiala sideris]